MKDYERQQFREAFEKKETARDMCEHMALTRGETLPMDERADLEWRRLEAQHAYDEANSEYENLVKSMFGPSHTPVTGDWSGARNQSDTP